MKLQIVQVLSVFSKALAGSVQRAFIRLHQDEGMDHRGPQHGIGLGPGLRLRIRDFAELAVAHPSGNAVLVVVRDAHGHVDEVELGADEDHAALGKVALQFCPRQARGFEIDFGAQFGIVFRLGFHANTQ